MKKNLFIFTLSIILITLCSPTFCHADYEFNDLKHRFLKLIDWS